jgi:hypothetical protein
VEWITVVKIMANWNGILYCIIFHREIIIIKRRANICVYVLVMSVLFNSENYIRIVRGKMVSTLHV